MSKKHENGAAIRSGLTPNQIDLFQELEERTSDTPTIEYYVGAAATVPCFMPAERKLDPVEIEEKDIAK